MGKQKYKAYKYIKNMGKLQMPNQQQFSDACIALHKSLTFFLCQIEKSNKHFLC